MSDRRNKDLLDTLEETKRLVGDLETSAGGAFSLDDILAEFGQGAAEPAPREEPTALVEENCDFLVSIPMKSSLDSLNASAAAAILLYEAVRQRL